MSDAVKLTVEEALSALPDNPKPDDWSEDENGPWEDLVHVFMNPRFGVVIGADWSREAVVDAIRNAEARHIGGDMCRGVGHGLAVMDGSRWLFVEADEGRLAELDTPQD